MTVQERREQMRWFRACADTKHPRATLWTVITVLALVLLCVVTLIASTHETAVDPVGAQVYRELVADKGDSMGMFKTADGKVLSTSETPPAEAKPEPTDDEKQQEDEQEPEPEKD